MSRGDMLKKPCTDHLGNSYDSITSMCETYRINPVTFSKRIQRGKTLEQALTESVRPRAIQTNRSCVDHLGNQFKSTADMCRYYGIDYPVYQNRIGLGWSVKDALTTKLRNGHSNKVCRTVYHSYKLSYLGKFYIVYAASPHEAMQRWELFKGYLNPQPGVDILELKPGTEIHDYCTII